MSRHALDVIADGGWVLAVLFVAAGLSWPSMPDAHPGGTDDEGCHVCRTDCDKWDEEAGDRHCHSGNDEESDEADDENSEEERETIALSEGVRVYVDKVLDGDTLVVRPVDEADGARLRIRVLGIDCPESHKNPKCQRQGREGGPGCEEQIPRGKEAAKRVAELIKHEIVRLESGEDDGEFESGSYDRLLAYIRLEDGRDLGAFLVGEGLCQDYGHKYPHPRHEEYQEVSE